jgi:aminopeptidase
MRPLIDPRAEKLAHILVDYSMSIGSGDVLMLRYEDAFSDFADYVSSLVERRGATSFQGELPLMEKVAMIERNDLSELKDYSEIACADARKSTAALKVRATVDSGVLKRMNHKKLNDFNTIVSTPVSNILTGDGNGNKGAKWCVAAYPCEEHARIAGMDLEYYKDFVYAATNIEWEKTAEKMDRIKDIFDNAGDVHIKVPNGTNVHLSLAGRGGVLPAGSSTCLTERSTTAPSRIRQMGKYSSHTNRRVSISGRAQKA